MKRFAAVAALAVLGAACSGSGGGGDEARRGASAERPASWATAAELRWLERLRRWDDRLTRADDVTSTIENDVKRFEQVVRGREPIRSRYARALLPFLNCSRLFEEIVGRAPTERLRAVARGYRRGCAAYERGARLLLRQSGDDPEYVLDRAYAEFGIGQVPVAVADGRLPPGRVQPLPTLNGRVSRSRIEPVFSQVASRIAGKEVEVRCWSHADWRRLDREEVAWTGERIVSEAGYANAGGRRIQLSPTVRIRLVQLRYERRYPPPAQAMEGVAFAVVTLAHEAEHAAGVENEARAECHSVQHARQVAVELGAPRAYAESLVRLYWRSVYGGLDREYRSRKCRDGGPFDLRSDSSVFP